MLFTTGKAVQVFIFFVCLFRACWVRLSHRVWLVPESSRLFDIRFLPSYHPSCPNPPYLFRSLSDKYVQYQKKKMDLSYVELCKTI